MKYQLGEGGFSYVYLVEDFNTLKRYALKKMTCQDEQQVQDALREVELYRLFDSNNIIKVVDYAVEPNRQNSDAKDVLVLLPHYKQGTLQDAIEMLAATDDRFDERTLLKLFLGVCLALQELHRYTPPNQSAPTPLAHRDIKPGNVLLSDDQTPVLMDFGSVAKARVEVNSRREALALQDVASERCSMPFRAPELFDVSSQCVVDERVDIWSLGCTLYAMAYHSSPFESHIGEQGGSLALAVISGRVNFPKQDEYSQDVRDLIDYMLVTNHLARPRIEQVIEKTQSLLR